MRLVEVAAEGALGKLGAAFEIAADADPHNDRALEQQMLQSINALGIGPQGFGGTVTALAVQIETFPTHIAGLPVAVNINCHVTRHQSEVI